MPASRMVHLRLALLALGAALLAAAGAMPARASSAPGSPTYATEPLAIVVNRSNPMNGISLADLRRIYRGQRGRWSNGRRVTLVMRDPGAPERDAILRSLYGVGEEEYRRGFLQAIFTGEASDAPKMLATPKGVLRFVFNVPGAIGYVRASEVDASVKTLRVDGRLPGEAGYGLEVGTP
jgi:ABC-type phosphate transport system substrate-binding protein